MTDTEQPAEPAASEGTKKPVEVLIGRQIEPAVLAIVDNAKEYIVLACPFVEHIPELANALAKAKERGVDTMLLTQRPLRKRLDSLQEFVDVSGIEARQVRSVHAKIYMNEDIAMVGSFNLLPNHRDSTDACTLIADDESHDALLDWTDSLEEKSTDIDYSGEDRRGRRGGNCKSCGRPDDDVSERRPLCRPCFDRDRRSGRGR